MIARVLRAIAIAIAIAAAIDPALTSMRTVRPEVVVLAADSARDQALAARVVRELSAKFTVIAAPFAAASGTVIVGNTLPRSSDELTSPVFAVLPERQGPTVTLEAVNAPTRSPLDARVTVSASARVTGARGRALEVTLRMGGLVVDRAERNVASDDETLMLPLAIVPPAPGTMPLSVAARIVGAGATVLSDLVVDVPDHRWAVLFFDPRPSWMSTFVRRAIERDPRFVVTSRVVTSRNISTDVGKPPSSLNDLAALGLFDAVVVGAPDALSAPDVAGLDAFLRRQGGGVVLLFDQQVAGPYERLTEVAQWRAVDAGKAVPFAPIANDGGVLRASAMAWPAQLPDGAEVLAGDSAQHRPVVWQSAVGAGRLVVSGAFDAWHYRDALLSGFGTFWPTVVADAAAGAVPAVDIVVEHPVLTPDASTDVVVTLRDAALASLTPGRAVRGTVGATIETPAGRVDIRLLPDGTRGQFRGAFRAPHAPGMYRLVASSDGARADVPIVVAPVVSRAVANDVPFITEWVRAHGGSVVTESELSQLSDVLSGSLKPEARRLLWHPMRSPWWIVPLVLALGAEWWWRRRRGLP